MTPLYLPKNAEIAQELVDQGAAINAQDQTKEKPLHFLVFNKQLETAQVLIAQQAEINKPTINGETTLHYATKRGFLEMTRLLLANGANVNMQDNDKGIPLHGAVSMGHLLVVQELLNHDANNVNTPDRLGQTPLHTAYFKVYTKIQQTLKYRGADTHIKDNLHREPSELANLQRDNHVIKREVFTTAYKIGELKATDE